QLDLLAAPGCERQIGDLEVALPEDGHGLSPDDVVVGARDAHRRTAPISGLGAAAPSFSPRSTHRSGTRGPGRTAPGRATYEASARFRSSRTGTGPGSTPPCRAMWSDTTSPI